MEKTGAVEGQEGQLTHAQIWDDFSLVQSWNEAAEEYKAYHSVHARGESMDALLEKYENGTLGDDLGLGSIGDVVSPVSQTMVDGKQDKMMDIDQPANGESKEVKDTTQQKEAPTLHAKADSFNATIKEPTPNALLTLAAGSSEDLKALMMSWYYAGYYTGLQEGKRQSAAQANR
ncbi:hypothetical protein KEM56_007800 [Ascosphaera pollenicola]|nr:hypothetical protein KEM56_007800 [Ascosphaera pollenicola]